ncbi:hypothetical protein EAI89_10270 [Eubacterium sp. am_0171]|nr:hypothetical protein EAI89_10270 [Eubacterium sp. am_0171]
MRNGGLGEGFAPVVGNHVLSACGNRDIRFTNMKIRENAGNAGMPREILMDFTRQAGAKL